MKLTTACLTLGLTSVLAAASPALAGDLSNGGAGGIKDYSYGGAAVPAPVPYEETFKWYVRGDLGTAFKHQGTVANDGLPIAFTQPSNWHELSIISMGFGRYIAPSLRTEFTLDYRPERSISSNGQNVFASVTGVSAQTTTTSPLTGLLVTANQTPTNFYTGNQNDAIGDQNTTFLASLFYDIPTHTRIRPYIGGGVGIAMHQLSLSGTTNYTCTNGQVVNVYSDGSPTQTVPSGCTNGGTSGLQQTFTTHANDTHVGYGLAAQLSAGLTYDLSARIHWDTGYRLLWQSGRVSVATSDGLSTLHLNNITDHEVRTGVRWDLW